MKRIFIICAIIIVVIIASEMSLQKKIFENFDYMISVLNDMDENKNQNYRLENIQNLESFWDSKGLLMAFYIDHGEIEKIKTQIVLIKAGIEEQDGSFVHEEIKHTIFIIEHIKDKIVLKIENIL